MEYDKVACLGLFVSTTKYSAAEYHEYLSLIKATGIKRFSIHKVRLRHPRSFIGSGQIQQLNDKIQAIQAKLLLINVDLSATQQRNLEKALGIAIKDRTALILTIFAHRARTYQGKLQVELAQLEYQNTRLVRGWTHLERQRGAIGQRGGAGEKQLEIDRRLLQNRMGQIRKRIQKLKRQRQLSHGTRSKIGLPTISLVGYTNAGKSTLFNTMTKSSAYASSQLFATLDPTIRRVRWDKGNFLIADTVGFIENLSSHLLESFAATLSEIKQSHLIIHLIDITDTEADRKKRVVDEVLASLGAETIDRLIVYNKIDHYAMSHQVRYDWQGNPQMLWLSAKTQIGLELLYQAINKKLNYQQLSMFHNSQPAAVMATEQLN